MVIYIHLFIASIVQPNFGARPQRFILLSIILVLIDFFQQILSAYFISFIKPWSKRSNNFSEPRKYESMNREENILKIELNPFDSFRTVAWTRKVENLISCEHFLALT